MDSRRENGECHTARAVLRRMVAKKQPVFDQWLVDIVNGRPDLLKEGGLTLDAFNALAAKQGLRPTPIATLPEPREPKPPKRPETVLEAKAPKPPLPPLTASQVPKRIYAIAERFRRDFGLSEGERDDMIRALRRAYPGEYPKRKELRRFFWNQLLPSD